MFGACSALRFARPTIILIDKLHRLRTPIRRRVLESKMNVIAQAGVEKLFGVNRSTCKHSPQSSPRGRGRIHAFGLAFPLGPYIRKLSRDHRGRALGSTLNLDPGVASR